MERFEINQSHLKLKGQEKHLTSLLNKYVDIHKPQVGLFGGLQDSF